MKRFSLVTLLILAVIASFLSPNICCAVDKTTFAQLTSGLSIPDTAPSFTKTSSAFTEYTSPKITLENAGTNAIIQPAFPKIGDNSVIREVAKEIGEKATAFFEPVIKVVTDSAKNCTPAKPVPSNPIVDPRLGPKQIDPQIYRDFTDQAKEFGEKAYNFLEPIVKNIVENAHTGEPIMPIHPQIPTEPIIDLGKPIKDEIGRVVAPVVNFLESLVKTTEERGNEFDPFNNPHLMNTNPPEEQAIETFWFNTMPKDAPGTAEPEGELTCIFTSKYHALASGIIPNDMYLTPQELRKLDANGGIQMGKSGFYTKDLPPSVVKCGIPGETHIYDDPFPRITGGPVIYDIEYYYYAKGSMDRIDEDGTIHYTIYSGDKHNHYYCSPEELPQNIDWYPQGKILDTPADDKENYNGNGVFVNGDGCDYSGMDGYGQEGFGEPRSEGSNYDSFGNYVGPNS